MSATRVGTRGCSDLGAPGPTHRGSSQSGTGRGRKELIWGRGWGQGQEQVGPTLWQVGCWGRRGLRRCERGAATSDGSNPRCLTRN